MALVSFGLQPKIQYDNNGNELLDDDGNIVYDFSDVSSYRNAIHSEILDLMYHSNGSFDWSTTYSEIPIVLRRFYIKKINSIIEKQNAEVENAKKSNNTNSTPTGPFRPKKMNPPTLNRRNIRK